MERNCAMNREEPMRMCGACPHPVSGHLKSSSACFIEGCMCGWEIRNGLKYQAHPQQDDVPVPIKKKVVVRAAVVRPPRKKQYERMFPGQACFYCDAAAESVDHLLPRSRGGRSQPRTPLE